MIKTLILFLFLSPLFLVAQKEGFLQYSISANALDTSLEVRQKVGLMRNSSLRIYFAEKFARVEFKMAGNYNVTTILDKAKNKSLNLMDSPMGKFAKRSNTNELQTVPIRVDSTSQIDVFKDEKKMILGFECYKLTNDFIPGFPMEFSAISEGVQLRYKASNLLFSLENQESLFSLQVPVGYTVVAPDE